MGLADDTRALVRSLTDLFEVCPPRIVIRGLRQDELDKPQDHREVVAQGVHRRGVQAGTVGSLFHRGIIARFAAARDVLHLVG